MGEWLTVWTIRSSLFLFVLCVACEISGFKRAWYPGWRMIWTMGFGLAIGHVAAAFQFYHHWSHQEAYQSTAQQTQASIGFSFGSGIYFNYLFVVLWGIDVLVAWWIDADQRMLSAAVPFLRWAGLAFLVFMAFNSTVVFESGLVRWAGIVSTMLLLGVVAVRVRFLASDSTRR